MRREVDTVVAVVAWVASLFATYWCDWLAALVLIGATTINLLHARFTDWFAGSSLQQRVAGFLAPNIALWEERLAAMEKDVADCKEAQVKMMGAFRGRVHP